MTIDVCKIDTASISPFERLPDQRMEVLEGQVANKASAKPVGVSMWCHKRSLPIRDSLGLTQTLEHSTFSTQESPMAMSLQLNQ